MSTKEQKHNWIPEFVYVDNNKLPTVIVPKGKDMVPIIFVCANFETGETTISPDGTEVPICDFDIYQYFSYNHAKEVLSAKELDKLRAAFGLDNLKKATKSGQKITDSVIKKLNNE